MAGIAVAASQDKYSLPEPYLAWEKAYLKEFPELQGLMDVMIATTVQQLKDPECRHPPQPRVLGPGLRDGKAAVQP